MEGLLRASLLAWVFVGLMLTVLFTMSNRASGVVGPVSAEDGYCGRGRSIACTHFSAPVRYEAEGRPRTTIAALGSKYGHGHPIRHASRSEGDRVLVFFTEGSEDHGYVVPASWPWIALCMLLSPGIVVGGWLLLPRPDPDETYPELQPPLS